MEDEIAIASSSADFGIGCWNLLSGKEHLRYSSCASPSHGLISVAGRFLASSQLRDPSSSSSSGSVLFWSWNKPQVEVKSFPAEAINPLACNSDGTYIVGGGASGDIYLWEVETGRLLKKWHGHYRAVTCLVFSEDQSLLVSGAEDGSVRVWSLLMIFDEERQQRAGHLYHYSFSEHALPVTDIVIGHGGSNAIILSASQDRTCKVWSLARGTLLRNIVFPSIIDAVALDPGEHVFYAGGRDGKIYIAELNAQGTSNYTYGLHIIGTLSDQSKAICSLAFALDGIQLVAGSEDGMVRVWDTKTHNIIRVLKHAKGPVNNILVIRQPPALYPRTSANNQVSIPKKLHAMPPALQKYTSIDEQAEFNAYIAPRPDYHRPCDVTYRTIDSMNRQIKELQQHGSSGTSEMELERLKQDNKRSMQMVQQWKKMYENLHQYCVGELLNGEGDDTNMKL
ncbi:protein ROOT INITIATION DEFECTIVE 3-like [Rutidosis leptorrhynchoides]|uniref:protein ROOT INITIATION DEFECTIVE 3-like n=1 Tax=Rutidosis leptorrhynchoides TaxID=125765 RepID=UPI003A993101